jgi:hypothetical protein
MSGLGNNRSRVFSEVVSIDAWHRPFGDGAELVDLHADVVFLSARVGEEQESTVRFRLGIKRAEVVVVVPEHEPVAIDKWSVQRDAQEFQGRVTETFGQSASAAGEMAAGTSASGPHFSARGRLAAEVQASKVIERSAPLRLIVALQGKSPDEHYQWTLTPQSAGVLQGKSFDPSVPRLKLRDIRTDTSRGLPPCVRVDVRCRQEDLAIDDILIKDEGRWAKIQSRFGFANRRAAAIAYIRRALIEEGLDVANIDDPFGRVTLASVLAEPG